MLCKHSPLLEVDGRGEASCTALSILSPKKQSESHFLVGKATSQNAKSFDKLEKQVLSWPSIVKLMSFPFRTTYAGLISTNAACLVSYKSVEVADDLECLELACKR